MNRRLKSLARLVVDQSDQGELPYIALEHVAGGSGALMIGAELPIHEGWEQGSSAVRPGDVLFGKLRPYLAKAYLVGAPAYASTELMALRPLPEMESRFLCYLVSSRSLIEWATASSDGTKMPRTSWEKIGEFRVNAVPPISTQRAIADYLDTETSRIDALIDKKRRMIELLEERLQTAIRERLTSLAVPTLPLKRSWKVIDCKHRTPTYVDEGFPVISPGDVSPGRLDLSRATRFVNRGDLEELTDGPRRPRRGDIIYSRNASIGTAAYVETDDRFCMGQDVCLITSAESDQLFLTYVLNTIGLDQLEEQKIGSTFSRINIAQIIELLVPMPEVATQSALAREFDLASAQGRGARSMLHRQIDLLRERRQALITAAVTGELEIPGVAE